MKHLLISTAMLACSGILTITAQSTQRVYLSGTGFDNTVEWDFYCSEGMNSGSWSRIAVPSCWEQEGFGNYNYGRVSIAEHNKEEGTYRHQFPVPDEWKGQHVRIVFEGVMTDASVRINGRSAGPGHQGAFYEFGYDISKMLRYGQENELEVHVKKFSDNMTVNEAERRGDYWVFGGIFRPVYLEVKPPEHIRRVAIDAKADGSLKAVVFLAGIRKASAVSLAVLDAEGRPLGSFESALERRASKVRIEGKAGDIDPWSPEYPNLYTAAFILRNESGEVLHTHEERIGFRTVEVREQDGVYVNGARIRFKGVNRHTFHPDHGRTSCKTFSIEVVNLLKDMNMNAVRMSHYPPDVHFLDVCDSMGLFVLDELAGWQRPPYDSIVGKKLLHEMIERDVNHPSIVFWDNGNEGGWNRSLDKYFGEADIQGRRVLHPWENFNGTNTGHYVDYDYLSLDHFSKRRIFFPTELLHGLYDGGHGAGLEDYWLRMWHHPLAAGAFLWVFADEGLRRSDNGEIDVYGNAAPDGILGPYHEKEASFYTIREVWAPVYFEDRYITEAFNGMFRIENRFHYTPLNECTFRYTWAMLPDPDGRGTEVVDDYTTVEILADGIPEVDPLLPGQKGMLKVPLAGDWQDADVLYIEASDPHGRFIHRWSWPVKSPSKLTSELLDAGQVGDGTTGSEGVRQSEQGDLLILEAAGVEVSIDRTTGLLHSVRTDDRETRLSGGQLVGTEMPELAEITQARMGNVVEVTASFEGGTEYLWTMHPDGKLGLQARYRLSNGLYPFAGLRFSYPETRARKIRYMGDGPYRVWKNRMKGNNFNVWEKDWNNTITGHSGWDYPEFKGYHAKLYWARLMDDAEQGFTVYSRTEDLFLKLYTPEEAPEPRGTTVVHPEGDLCFLHTIPAIGTKFRGAENFGPQSRPAQYRSVRTPFGLEMKLVFDFAE